MYDIMGLFVFQVLRCLFFSYFMQIFDFIMDELEKKKDKVDVGLKDCYEVFWNVVKYVDEEVRRLVYWSDVKQMVENGEMNVMEECKGWDGEEWEGIDQSGFGELMKGKFLLG